jgi:hypothetical protein
VKLKRIRPGYYKTAEGHVVERYAAFGGAPLTWVIVYPSRNTADVSRPTLRQAAAYLEQFPTDD